MEVFPYAWIFFVLFILIATFVIFNLFIAVIVDSITADKEQDRKDHEQLNAIENELRTVHRELSELKHLLQQQSAPPRS
jgi:voltage-gated sodium channel